MTDINTMLIRKDALTIAAGQLPSADNDIQAIATETLRLADLYADYIRHGSQTATLDTRTGNYL